MFLRHYLADHSCRMQCLSGLVHLHLLFERQTHRQGILRARRRLGFRLCIRYYSLLQPVPFRAHRPFFLWNVNRLALYPLANLMCMRRLLFIVLNQSILATTLVARHCELWTVSVLSLLLAESGKSWWCIYMAEYLLLQLFWQATISGDVSSLWCFSGIVIKLMRILADHIPNVGFFVDFTKFSRAIPLVYNTLTVKSAVVHINLLLFLNCLLLNLLQNEQRSLT